MLEERLGNTNEMDLSEALVSTNAGLDQLTHVLEDKGGLERQPLHGALHVHSVRFTSGCINRVIVLPCLNNVHDNLRCHDLDKVLNRALGRRSEMHKLRLLGTLPNLHVHNLRCQMVANRQQMKGSGTPQRGPELAKEVLAQRVLHCHTI
jgi:hypothetical protein